MNKVSSLAGAVGGTCVAPIDGLPRVIASVAILLLVSCSPRDTEVARGSRFIVGGEVEQSHPAVVALTIDGQAYCTGTLIAPKVIVTAAHCLPPFLQDQSIDDIKIFFGHDVQQKGMWFPVFAAEAHPQYSLDRSLNDIGLIALEEAAPYAPIPLARREFDGVGVPLWAVGFGRGSTSGTGVKRRTLLDLLSFDEHSIVLGPQEGITCSGDSGGPLLSTEAGVEVVVAVHSLSNCNDQAVDERIAPHGESFIAEFVARYNGAALCEQDGLCAADCERPDPDCPCASDSFCTSVCSELQSDSDCPTSCAVEDGYCDGSCPIDPDCGPLCEQDGACAVCTSADCEVVRGGCSAVSGRSSGKGAYLLVIMALFACSLRSRRRALGQS